MSQNEFILYVPIDKQIHFFWDEHICLSVWFMFEKFNDFIISMQHLGDFN